MIKFIVGLITGLYFCSNYEVAMNKKTAEAEDKYNRCYYAVSAMIEVSR